MGIYVNGANDNNKIDFKEIRIEFIWVFSQFLFLPARYWTPLISLCLSAAVHALLERA